MPDNTCDIIRDVGRALVFGLCVIGAAVDVHQRRCPHTFWTRERCDRCGITITRLHRMRDKEQR